MPRFFITTNASLNHAAGGVGFEFEPVALRGGSWLGVLAVDEESAANILLSAGFDHVAEISAERYENLKKKETARPTSSPRPPDGPAPLVEGVAGVVGQTSAHGGGDTTDLAKNPNSTAGISAVSLLSGPVNPPHEPLLEQAATRRSRPIRKP